MEMVHTRLSQKSEFNNFSQWLEPGMKDKCSYTCWDSEIACTSWSITKDVENGATEQSWKLYLRIIMAVIVYDHEIFYDFFLRIYIITISLAVEED